jgi:ectoine hydroxylase-related dioxygenase (phytanoyl-CoA dioxygenase family)
MLMDSPLMQSFSVFSTDGDCCGGVVHVLCRDVFISKAVDNDDTCDWHVDDVGFWPEAFESDNQGINVWIALDDMPREYQGSMALAPESHHAPWRHDAYAAIGLNLTFRGGLYQKESY